MQRNQPHNLASAKGDIVICSEETAKFYQDLMSGKTENTKGLSLK